MSDTPQTKSVADTLSRSAYEVLRTVEIMEMELAAVTKGRDEARAIRDELALESASQRDRAMHAEQCVAELRDRVAELEAALLNIIGLRCKWPRWDGEDLYEVAYQTASDAIASTQPKEVKP